jgi:hypothetical protein
MGKRDEKEIGHISVEYVGPTERDRSKMSWRLVVEAERDAEEDSSPGTKGGRP